MNGMSETRRRQLLTLAAIGIAFASITPPLALMQEPWTGVLDEHPAIQYAVRPTTDRIAKLNHAWIHEERSLQRDPRTGYLLPLLDALGVSPESQVLVFSKTGV